ncbi:histidine phosphatase family protein [Marinobacter sp. VGCF2001]|uniref:histidine phosphatase family protein n=1 Tax=Marinobacter sp. VGCF2001 TaxID=3417189 RepID=UPI003CF7D1F1
MTTTVIDLIRHGEPEGGQMFRGSKDDPLSDLGWQQMTAAVTDRDQWDIIISSPMQRCQHFARQLSEQHRLPLHLEADLREIGFGEWEGMTGDQVRASYGEKLQQFWADPVNAHPPGGEPVSDFFERVLRGFERCQQTFDGQRVLVVCHGGVIRMILASVLGIPLEKSFTGFAVPYACRSRIQIDRSEYGVFRSLISHQP